MGYEDLRVYQLAYNLMLEIYQKSSNLPAEEKYGLTSQIRRSAMSIVLNIAEGYGRKDSAKEFKHFLRNAQGSCNETRTLIKMSCDLKYLSQEESKKLSEEYEKLSKMLYRLKENWTDI